MAALLLNKTPRALLWTGSIVSAALVAGVYFLWPAGNPLRVQLLDVGGYTDPVPVWMPFRVTLGLTNAGRDLVTIRRIHIEPDFADFNEAYNVGTLELNPPLVVEPGSSLSYQASATLLNATQLQPGTHPLTLRVRIEQNGTEIVHEFPAKFVQSLEASQRVLHYARP